MLSGMLLIFGSVQVDEFYNSQDVGEYLQLKLKVVLIVYLQVGDFWFHISTMY